MSTIDLNADLGESWGRWTLGDDEAMLGLVTSANVACGFHAGDPLTTMATCRAAADRGIAIGAHPSYRDLLGFGRREMVIGAGEPYLPGVSLGHNEHVAFALTIWAFSTGQMLLAVIGVGACAFVLKRFFLSDI